MSRLKFGMLLLPVHNPGHDPTVQLGQDVALAEHADALGFDEFWFGEHHSGGWQIIANPLLMVARAAATTRRIRLGGVSASAYHHPKLLLESAVQLDHMTRGRFMFGVGAEALALDSLMLGLEPGNAHEAAAESLEAMLLLLEADGPVSYTPQRADWQLVDAYLQLGPYSDPLDVRIAVFDSLSNPASNTVSGPRLAGRWGLGLISFGAANGLGKENQLALAAQKAQDAAAQYGRTVDRSRWSVVSPVHLAPTEKQARAEVQFGLRQYADYIRHLPLGVPADADIDTLVDALHLAGHGVVGTPAMAVGHIERIQELSGGVGTFLLEHAGWASHAHTCSSLELFATQVAPHFTGSTRARRAAYAREMKHDPSSRRTVEARAADLQHSAEMREQQQKAQLAAAVERILDEVFGESTPKETHADAAATAETP